MIEDSGEGGGGIGVRRGKMLEKEKREQKENWNDWEEKEKMEQKKEIGVKKSFRR